VKAGVPLHGANLTPDDAVLPDFRRTVLEYIEQVTRLGHRVLDAIARSLGLAPGYFASRCTVDPLILFRIFLYPSRPVPADLGALYGVGEHTDYGLLTLLRQDTVGGLQVKTASGWIDPSEAAPVPASFVCNIGDMLDRMTGGLYKSTPHRVRINMSGRDRLSFPLRPLRRLASDPDFDVRIEPIRTPDTDDAASRRDGASVHDFDGTYGDYVLAKVEKVFPDLKRDVL
jgi:isopenicillin N synthase-like dioxygenase